MQTNITVENLTTAILEASERLSQSENTRYPFNCTNAAITADSEGRVYCGSNLNPSADEILLMDEQTMCDQITEDMTHEIAQALAEQTLSELND